MFFPIGCNPRRKKRLGTFPVGPKKSLQQCVLVTILHPKVCVPMQQQKLNHLRCPRIENGRLVLVPGRAKVGDRICFSRGDFTVPLVLRACEPLNGTTEVDAELEDVKAFKGFKRIGHFEFVGECFIDELVRRPAERIKTVLNVKLWPPGIKVLQ